jgi:hypothetical protein
MESQSDAGDPIAIAVHFAAVHSTSGFRLDFSLGSLETEIDRVLELPIFFRGRNGSPSDGEERAAAALGAYVGEALRRLLGGKWGGRFHPDSNARNFYESFVEFGGCRYWPSHFISYRLTNWPEEGSFAEHLRKTMSELQARESE